MTNTFVEFPQVQELYICNINFGIFKAELEISSGSLINHVKILEKKEKFKESLTEHKLYVGKFTMKENVIYTDKIYGEFIDKECYLFRTQFKHAHSSVVAVEIDDGEYAFVSLNHYSGNVYGDIVEGEFDIYNDVVRHRVVIEQYLIKKNKRMYETNVEYEPVYSSEEMKQMYKLKEGSTNIFEIPILSIYNDNVKYKDKLYIEYLDNGNIKFIIEYA